MIYVQLRARVKLAQGETLHVADAAKVLGSEKAGHCSLFCPTAPGVYTLDAIAVAKALKKVFPQEDISLIGADVCYVHRIKARGKDFLRPVRTAAALLILGGVTIFIFVERFLAIRKASTLDMNFMNRIRDFILDGKIAAAVDLCRKTDTPIARMIEKGIERLGRPMSDVQSAIENVANLEVSKLENGLPSLATIAGGAPMIGFLGTVLGMVQTFMDMSAAGGTVDMSLLAGGMYVAMVTTVAGLIVGIPAYFGYNYLVARIEKLVFQMEANSIAFMDILNQPVQK